MAKARRCARSTVSRACLPGGPLHAALLPGGDRLDAAHPACRAWIGQPAGPYVYGFTLSDARELGMLEPAPSVEVLIDETMPTLAEAAARVGLSVEEFAREAHEHFPDAIIPHGHISAAEFAERADVDVQDVLDAIEGELAPALLPSGRLDLGHVASLEFMAAHPFERSRNGDPDAPCYISGQPWLAPACVGEDIDVSHPVAQAFIARCHGRVPTDAEPGTP